MLKKKHSNPTMSLGKVYGLTKGDLRPTERGLLGLKDYGSVHLLHMVAVHQLPLSQP